MVGLIDRGFEYTVFHTDDDVFFRRSSAVPLPTGASACFSFRLGLNTTYSYSVGNSQVVPELVEGGEVVAWDWTRAEHDFGYPLSLDGHLMATQLVPSSPSQPIRDPNELEEELALKRYLRPG